MINIHCTLQGKGGVGKTVVSSLIAQHQMASGAPVLCIDTDPVNTSFASFEAFEAKHIQVRKGGQFDDRAFDDLIRRLMATECQVVIDNGASTFVPFLQCLLENGAIPILKDMGKSFILHTVIVGGEGLEDSLNGFVQLAAQLPPETDLVVWLNEYFGPVERDGKDFEHLKAYQTYQDRIFGIIRLPKYSDRIEETIREMREQKLTFDEAIASVDFDILHKQRLVMVKRELFDQLSLVLGSPPVVKAGAAS